MGRVRLRNESGTRRTYAFCGIHTCSAGLLTTVSTSDTTPLTFAFSHSAPEREHRFSTCTMFPRPPFTCSGGKGSEGSPTGSPAEGALRESHSPGVRVVQVHARGLAVAQLYMPCNTIHYGISIGPFKVNRDFNTALEIRAGFHRRCRCCRTCTATAEARCRCFSPH